MLSGDKPIVYTGKRRELFYHVWGEWNETPNWYAIGMSIRLAIAAFVEAFPESANGQTDIDGWMNGAITEYVSNYFDHVPNRVYGNLNNTEGPGHDWIAQDAARQCALGNKAACGN